MKSVDLKGQVKEYRYSNRDFLLTDAAPDGTVSYSYNAAGNRTAMTDATGTTSYSYYPSGELAGIQYPDHTKLSFDYEARSMRTTQTITAQNLSMTMNTKYLSVYPTPSSLTVKDGSGSNLAEFTYSFDRLTRRMSGISSASGLNETYQYDGFNLAGIQQIQNNTAFANYSYAYDNNRNIVAKNDNGAGYQFSYDPLNRIKTSSQFNEAYTYDNRDNRRTLQSDQVPNIKGASYAYDSRNRLTQVTTEDGKAVSYRYNGDNLMVERTEGGVTTRYYYDDRAKIVAEGKVEANGSVTITASYVHDDYGKLLARQVPGQGMQYYVSNGHGDITEIRDAQGNVLNRYTYDIWGNPLVQEERVPNIFRYSGEYWDAATNLQYLRARWYDPSVGRFINEDTYEGEIKNPLSLNLYTYVENNPLTKVDPSGNSATNLCMYSFEFNCFSAGTKVQTDEGLKPIEEIQVGDKVQTRDEETGETAYNLVEELFQRETDETYHVSVNGTTIVTTAEHPFWVSGEGWVEARDLKKGDMLVDLDENEVPIEEIEIKKERTTVYNFRVQSVHNYFVTDLKIWTHNCGGSYGGMSGARLSSSSSGARVGGVGGGYSRPANVSRGTTGVRIEVTKKSADQFYKSTLDKALKPQGTGKAPAVKELSRAQKRNLETLDNIVNKHLTEMDFSGTLRDLKGNPVPKPGGGYWNHLQEMQDSYKGLSKIKWGFEGSLQNPNLSDSIRKTLQDSLDKANTNLKKIEDLFAPFGGVK